MEIIISHSNTDFDGLAAMVAAKKLHPEAVLVAAGKMCRNVEEFMALYKDTFQIRKAKEIPLNKVKKVIVVDTKTASRLGPVAKIIGKPGLEVIIYDHHPRNEEDVKGQVEVVDQVGATTTLLVEEIQRAGLPLHPLEATLLAIGIYEDTGSLTFTTTTARDAAAVAYLLRQGANLKLLAEFIERPLTESQKQLLNRLIINAQHHLVNGVKVLLSRSSGEEFISGLALLVHKLGEIEAVDVIIAAVEMEDRVQIVARSRCEGVDVADLLEPFGGAGHAKAASASVKDMTLDEVLKQLEQIMKERIRPLLTARDLMSAPVKTVFPHTSIDEAGKIMLRYGHSGLPVVNENLDLVGIISRRDIDKAQLHNLGHAPVKGYMSRKVITIEPHVPLPEIQRLLIEHNIGRLPVVEQGRLVGIVSRTDVLRTLHGDLLPHRIQAVYLPEEEASGERKTIKQLLQERLPAEITDLLAKISYVAAKNHRQVYVVGGFVRDLLLGVENFDIDLVVEGDGIAFGQELAEFFCGRVRTHEKFGTAIVILPNDFKIDVATARTEYYEYPAALPRVEKSTLREDLYRRDFTINAMAIDLSRDNFGQLVDYFGGRRDLEEGVIRVLYNLSFVEDPTRILRAIRFEQRYNFLMETTTLRLAQQAIKDQWLTKLSYDRIREELKHIFSEDNPSKAIFRMQELGLWDLIIPELNLDQQCCLVLEALPREILWLKEQAVGKEAFQPWLAYMMGLLYRLPVAQQEEVVERMRLAAVERDTILAAMKAWPQVQLLLREWPQITLGRLAAHLDELGWEAGAFFLAATQKPGPHGMLQAYYARRRELKLHISGNDLIQLGIPRGPVYRTILAEIRRSKLDGKAVTREDEIQLAREIARREGFNV